MVMNDAGKMAWDEWMKTSEIRKNVELDAFIVMPNHIHGIIVITERRGELNSPDDDTPDNGRGVLHTPNDNIPIDKKGEFNSPLPDNDSTPNKGVCNTPLRSPSQTVGSIVRGYK